MTAAKLQQAGDRRSLLQAAAAAVISRRLPATACLLGLIVVAGAAATVARAHPSRPKPAHFFLLRPGATGLPRSDSYCARAVAANQWEPRSDNNAANHAVPSNPSAVPWNPNHDRWWRFIQNRSHVTGRYTGTTDQIIRWAACKWGIDENLVRAVVTQESYWHQNYVGDNGHSFGLTQIRDAGNASPAGTHDGWGGYPYTLHYTALNVDFYGAYLRSCYDGDFYDGGSWLYGGRTIQQVIASNGAEGALWGCVGAWFSGDWYSDSAQRYINNVKALLDQKPWQRF
jgi:hypothetical protein